MEKHIKRWIKPFWLWQEEKESDWLRQMSLKGWHLIKACICVYTFEQGDPKDIVYYRDLRSLNKSDENEYIEIFKDMGWSYIFRQGIWYYFSSPADNKYKEVYSDNQSRLGKYGILLSMHIIALVLLSNGLRIVSGRVANNETLLMEALLFVAFILFMILIYSTINLIVLVTKLRKSPKE
ncbi:MAG: DUF2812 domain-containing protein [Anaerolineaceae bacterium]